MKIINIYLVVINLISLILMITDKLLAIKNKQRISEFHLLTITLFGGSIGTMIAMILVRHKIRKLKFLLLVPLSLILHILIYFYL